MDTAYDWITVMIFAGLIVLFLQRSTSEQVAEGDSLWLYLGAGVACAVANYLGNHGLPWLAIPLIVATVAYIIYWLKPFATGPRQ